MDRTVVVHGTGMDNPITWGNDFMQQIRLIPLDLTCHTLYEHLDRFGQPPGTVPRIVLYDTHGNCIRTDVDNLSNERWTGLGPTISL